MFKFLFLILKKKIEKGHFKNVLFNFYKILLNFIFFVKSILDAKRHKYFLLFLVPYHIFF